ncbi:hypothetical protein VTN31DRAFT_2996 [Thermomyces dupontii]|uniref:uncharacterized protein n=1 Tax=Talaromyces thermophilus TaxID=28565 RepID=UPI003744550E
MRVFSTILFAWHIPNDVCLLASRYRLSAVFFVFFRAVLRMCHRYPGWITLVRSLFVGVFVCYDGLDLKNITTLCSMFVAGKYRSSIKCRLKYVSSMNLLSSRTVCRYSNTNEKNQIPCVRVRVWSWYATHSFASLLTRNHVYPYLQSQSSSQSHESPEA